MCPRNSIGFGTSSSPTFTGNSTRNEQLTAEYWNKLFEGSDYWDLYQSILHSYSTPVPQSFFGALTGKNKTNAYQHEMAMNDELSALAEKMYNESYQSPDSDIARQRSAGLNPDITGLTGGLASEMSPDGVTSGASAENPLQQIQGLAGILLNAFTLGKGIAEGVQSFRGHRLDNLHKLMNIGSDVASFISPQSAFSHYSDITPGQAQAQEVDSLIGSLRFRKRENKILNSYVRSIVEHPSFREGYYGNLSRASSNRIDYFKNVSGSHYDEEDDTMRVLSKGLSDVMNLAEKTSKQRQISDDNEAIEFNDIYDSSGSAHAENAANTENASSAEFKTQLNSTLRDMIKDLSIEADKGSKLARGVQLALQFFLISKAGASL